MCNILWLWSQADIKSKNCVEILFTTTNLGDSRFFQFKLQAPSQCQVINIINYKYQCRIMCTLVITFPGPYLKVEQDQRVFNFVQRAPPNNLHPQVVSNASKSNFINQTLKMLCQGSQVTTNGHHSSHAFTSGHKLPLEHANFTGPMPFASNCCWPTRGRPSCRRASYTKFPFHWSPLQNKSTAWAISPPANTLPLPLQLPGFASYVDYFSI